LLTKQICFASGSPASRRIVPCGVNWRRLASKRSSKRPVNWRSDAIAKAGDLTVLVKAFNERDDRCAELQRELAALTGRRRASVTHVDQMVRDLRKRLDDCRRTLRRHAPIVRQILMRLIVDRLVFESDPSRGSTASLGPRRWGICWRAWSAFQGNRR
jgi:hypothetical protein